MTKWFLHLANSFIFDIMEILELKLRKHPILGDQDLKFSSVNGEAYNMIILAGENGVGKSSVVEIIYDFCSLKIPKLTKGEIREITIYLDFREINSIRYPGEEIPSLKELNGDSKIILGFDESDLNHREHFYLKTSKDKKNYCSQFLSNKHAKRILGSIYMDHDLNRNQHSVSFNLDGSNWLGRRSSEGSGFSAEKGILTLYNRTLKEVANYKKINNKIDKVFYKPIFNLKSLPLNNAISELIPSLSIFGISEDGRKILMKKGDDVFEFSKLSSGEKQILGMTAFLTYDLEISVGAIILIDEPENNLHPSLQLKLRTYFGELFPDRQIFIVTHSPFVIHNNHLQNEKVFIFKRTKKQIDISELGEFYGWDRLKKVNEAFRIDHLYNDLNNQPVVLVEGETDEKYLNVIKQRYFKSIPVKIEWVGSYNSDGSAVFTGSSALDQVKNFILSNPKIIPNKLMLLYDCDVDKVNKKQVGRLFINKIPKNPKASIMDKGIENSLIFEANMDLDPFYSTTKNQGSYGQVVTKRNFNKTKFAEHICNLPLKEQDKCFSFLKKIFAEIIKDFV